jgi:hypothetical protein
MAMPQWTGVARRDVVATAVRAIVAVTVLLLLYYFVPVESRPR